VSDLKDNENIQKLSAQEKLALLKSQLLDKTKKEDVTFQMTYGQKALYFLYLNTPESTAYNVAFSVRIKSHLNIPALKKSFQRILNRDQCLRSNFKIENGKPVQTVSGFKDIFFRSEDHSEKSEKDIKEIINSYHRTPFDLENGDVFKVYLVKVSDENYILLISVHHIACDGWSIGTMLNELKQFYYAESDNLQISFSPLQKKYSDYVNFLEDFIKSEKGNEQWLYWETELKGDLPYLNLTPDKHRPAVQTYNGATEYLFLEKELEDKLKAISKSEGTTLFVTLLTAFFVFLYKYCGQEEIIVGLPTAGRTNTEFDKVIGYFINPVAVRAIVDPENSIADFLKQVKKKVLYAVANQDYPFPLIVEKILNKRDPSRSPVFQTFFGMQKIQQSDEIQELIVYGNDNVEVNWGSLKLQPYYLTQQDGQFDLTVEFIEGENSFSGAFKYNADIFNKDTIISMKENFITLLKNIVSDSEKSLKDLKILSDAEESKILNQWNDTETLIIEQTPVYHSIKKIADLYPDNTAVISDESEISFKKLVERSGKLTNHLIRKGVKPKDLICICMERSLDLVISILGILKAGAAYVPVDPSYPQNRIDHMIKDSGSKFILTQRSVSEKLRSDNSEILIADESNLEIMDENSEVPDINVTLEDPAYVIYTSGSSGIPKGVLISHRSLANHMQWMINEFGFDSNVCVLQKTPFSFDASVWEFYLPLMTGGKLVMAKPEAHMDTAYMKDLIIKSEVNVLQMVPTLLNLILDEPMIQDCKSLKFIFSGGEALTKTLCEKVFSKLDVTLCNLYGPTEATIDSTFYICNKNETDENIPIGKPVSNAKAYVLDKDLNPVPFGVAGELFLGGDNIALGYVNNISLTDEKFIADIFSNIPERKLYKTGDLAKYNSNGNLIFLGRADDQVKFRGYRIELGEIETALNSIENINTSVVLVREDKPGIQKLTAYLKLNNDSELEINEYKNELRKSLPEYMVPSAFILLESIPRTPNGKIDKSTLPAPEDSLSAQAGHIEPEKPVEKILANIWKEVLGVENVGIHDNFFELGGDSIISIQIISRANQEGIKISPRQVFQYQTISELSAVAEQKTAEAVDQNPVTGNALLIPIQQRFFQHNIKDPSHFNHSILLSLPDTISTEHLEKAVKEIHIHHDALRMSYEIIGNNLTQINNDIGNDTPFIVEDLTSLDPDNIDNKINELTINYHKNIDISKGKLFNAVLFRTGNNSGNKLLIIVHHLCIDGISWRIILEDLYRLYSNFQNNEDPKLPFKTISFKKWSDIIKEYSNSTDFKKEFDHWKEVSTESLIISQKDFNVNQNIVTSEENVNIEFSKEDTGLILKDVHKSYNTQINDILLTALILAFNKWNGENKLLLNLEGHGREDIADNSFSTDISRTVGWFTSVFPVLLKISSSKDTGECIKSVKENLRNIPNNGIGFGLLKYMSDDTEIKKSLSDFPEVEVVFNYLGQMNFQFLPTDWKIEEGLKLSQDGENKRFHSIEINAVVTDDKLLLEFNFSNNIYQRKNIEKLADHFKNSMNEIISHCTGEDKNSGFTPSDFSAAGLDQQELDDLLANLN